MRRYRHRCPTHGEFDAEVPVLAPCPVCKEPARRVFVPTYISGKARPTNAGNVRSK